MQEPVTPAAIRSGGSGSAMKGEDFTTFIKALTEKYGLFEGKSRIKPPPLALFGTPQHREEEKPKVDQPLSRVQDILSNADGAGVIRPANEEPGNVASPLNSGPLLKNHSPRTPTRVAGLGRNPIFDAPQSLQSPGFELHRMVSGGDPAATASPRRAGPPQSQASDAPPPLSFSQFPAVPSSDVEVRRSLLTQDRDPLERGRHPPHNPLVREVDPLIGARAPVDDASLPSSPSSPSSAAGSKRTPFPAVSLPLPDPASVQASSQPALPEERILRRPPRRVSLLPSIESELELLEAVVSNRPEAEGEGGSLFQAEPADDTRRLRDRTGASALGPDGGSLEQVQGAQVEELGGANASAIGRLQTTELTNGRQGQQYSGGGILDDRPEVEVLGAGSWLALNRSLRDNGFSALRSPQEGGFLEDVHAVFKDILKQYERRGAMVQVCACPLPIRGRDHKDCLCMEPFRFTCCRGVFEPAKAGWTLFKICRMVGILAFTFDHHYETPSAPLHKLPPSRVVQVSRLVSLIYLLF